MHLASEVFFDEKTLGESSLVGLGLGREDCRYIENIVVRMYGGKVPDIKETLEKRREAIGK